MRATGFSGAYVRFSYTLHFYLLVMLMHLFTFEHGRKGIWKSQDLVSTDFSSAAPRFLYSLNTRLWIAQVATEVQLEGSHSFYAVRYISEPSDSPFPIPSTSRLKPLNNAAFAQLPHFKPPVAILNKPVVPHGAFYHWRTI